jgi:hypothetical protein
VQGRDEVRKSTKTLKNRWELLSTQRQRNEEQKQDLGAKLRLIAAKALVGMIGYWVAQWGLVGRVTSGWLETRKFTSPSRSFFGVDDEPGRECIFMRVTRANNRTLLFLQRNYDDLGCILSHW